MDKLTKERQVKAETITGEATHEMQKRRARRAVLSAREAGKNTDLASAKEAIKRVGEYKKARGQKMADYRPPNHGKRKK